MEIYGQKRVLNAGSGSAASGRLHEGFRREDWTEVRLDIDPRTAPDLIGSISDMRSVVPDASFDAIWTSHSVEHLHAHEVEPAFREFRRVLKGDGFALVTCPDLAAIVEVILRRGVEAVVYQSPAGPIKALDMLYGHGRSIAAGQFAMAHNTGFTADRMGRVAIESGFVEARVIEGPNYDLWAVLLMPGTSLTFVSKYFESTKVAPLFSASIARNYRAEERLKRQPILSVGMAAARG
jgi:SAM-dependent methyltransferase